MRTTYDQHGRVFQTFDASRESASYADGGVRRVYNSRGHLLKLQDAVLSGSNPRTVYWEALEADASGRVVRLRGWTASRQKPLRTPCGKAVVNW